MAGNPPMGRSRGWLQQLGTSQPRWAPEAMGLEGGTQPSAAPCAPSARRPLPKSLQEQPGSGAFGCLSLWKPLLKVLGHG